MSADIHVRRVSSLSARQIDALSLILIDSVTTGASVGFMHPLSLARASAFWGEIARDLTAGARAMLIAEDEAGICGTVQLVLSQPDNQPHRADLCKMLVAPRARRKGVGAQLMQRAESLAAECDKSLLVLDTIPGSDAERLYTRLGWTPVGLIPDYALLPEGGLTGTVVFYRHVGGRTAADA